MSLISKAFAPDNIFGRHTQSMLASLSAPSAAWEVFMAVRLEHANLTVRDTRSSRPRDSDRIHASRHASGIGNQDSLLKLGHRESQGAATEIMTVLTYFASSVIGPTYIPACADVCGVFRGRGKRNCSPAIVKPVL